MKIFTMERLGKILEGWKHEGKSIIMCHGCFDILHLGHIEHLQAAANAGDILVVSVTADEYVNKGNGRPVFTAQERAEMLDALECVDYVAINHAPNELAALKQLKPNVYIKGPDYIGFECEYFNLAKSDGIRMAFTQTKKFSTTELIERIKKCL